MAPVPRALEKETLPGAARAVKPATPHPTKKISTLVSWSLGRGLGRGLLKEEKAKVIGC